MSPFKKISFYTIIYDICQEIANHDDNHDLCVKLLCPFMANGHHSKYMMLISMMAIVSC